MCCVLLSTLPCRLRQHSHVVPPPPPPHPPKHTHTPASAAGWPRQLLHRNRQARPRVSKRNAGLGLTPACWDLTHWHQQGTAAPTSQGRPLPPSLGLAQSLACLPASLPPCRAATSWPILSIPTDVSHTSRPGRWVAIAMAIACGLPAVGPSGDGCWIKVPRSLQPNNRSRTP